MIRTGIVNIAVLAALTGCPVIDHRAHSQHTPPAVRLDYEETEAVLGILSRKRHGQTITEPDWARLFSADAYELLGQRAEQLGRAFSDRDFKAFVLSDSVSRWQPGMEKALVDLKRLELRGPLERALAYLPESTRIDATVYVLVKPTVNNFTYVDKHYKPAVFLNLRPNTTVEILGNKLVHELFHVGYGRCYTALVRELTADRSLPGNYLQVMGEMVHLSEGLAMLSAAGGPDIHPHEASAPGDRARWDGDMADFDADFGRIDRFLQDVVHGRLSGEEIERIDSTFSGYQGPWYTVGWKIGVTIEKNLGRPRLIECIRDPRKLLSTYNEAASLTNRFRSGALPLFSESLIAWINP